MPTVELPHGPVRYRVAGPEHPTGPPVVFVHGVLVSGSLWAKTADALATAGVRSYAPDWPLGAHSIALGARADQSPRGVARQVLAFLEAFGLEDVTLVGNDSGGAICQLLLDIDAARIGRVVLTNCDSFDTFPPKVFWPLFKAVQRPAVTRALTVPMRSTTVRHSPAGFGLLVSEPLDPALTRAWLEPLLRDAGVRDDLARFARGIDAQELLGASSRLGGFTGRALLVWGAADRFFTLASARRLRDTFADAKLVEIAGGRTFVPLDEPRRLAAEIAAFQPAYTT